MCTENGYPWHLDDSPLPTGTDLWLEVTLGPNADEEQYVANLVAADIEWMGYSKLLLKHDNEFEAPDMYYNQLESSMNG